MTEEMRDLMKEEIKIAVQETVNGKIEAFRKENRDLMQSLSDDIKPFMQGAAGLQLFWKLLVGLGSLAVAWSAIKGFRL